jgi:hypothetical protein
MQDRMIDLQYNLVLEKQRAFVYEPVFKIEKPQLENLNDYGILYIDQTQHVTTLDRPKEYKIHATNCRNCGAPLHGEPLCEYCGTRNV